MKKWAKIFLGLSILSLFFTTFFIYERYVPVTLAANLKSEVIKSDILPSEIIIPSLNIDLPVFPATLKSGKWDLTSKGVSFLMFSDSSLVPTNNILYGHNWPNLLGNLTKLQLGQVIELKYQDNLKKDYIIISLKVVNPEDISILSNPSESEILTLYTCTGFLDSKRFVVTAKLI